MRRWVMSDLHLGHKNIDKFRKRIHPATGTVISSEEQHNLTFESIAALGKRDLLFLLGDVVFTEDWLKPLSELSCRVVMIGGNHDLPLKQIIQHGAINEVWGLRKHKQVWLSHSPIHPSELRGKKNVHGHSHYHLIQTQEGKPDTRYKNVCMEYTNFKPASWDYVMSDEYDQECFKKWVEYKELGLLGD